MPRQTRPSAIQANTLAPETAAAIAADLQAADALQPLQTAVSEHQGAIMETYGDGLPYDRLRYLDKCRYHMARSAEEALEVGRCLIVMKECEGHGSWLPLLQEIGVDQSVARRMMQAATRFSNRALTHDLIETAKSKTKLFELMVLDDDELAALNDGESVRGLQLDDIERMSVSELRRALRQEKADKEAAVSKVKAAVSGELAAKDRVIADKTKRIAELVEAKNRAECLTTDEQAAELERTLANETLHAVGSLLPIRQAIHRIRALPDAPQGLYVAAQNALDRVLAEAMAIATDYGIELNQLSGFEAFSDPNIGEDFGEGMGEIVE